MTLFPFMTIVFVSSHALAATPLILAKQDSDVQTAQSEWKPLIEAMATANGTTGIVMASPSAAKIAEAIAAGKANVMVDTPFNRVALDPGNKMVPAMTYWKKGKEEYAGCLFAPAGSTLATSKDLAGKKVVAEDPYSTGSFAAPLSALLIANPNQKIQIVDLKEMVKSGKEKNELQALKSLKVDAGTVVVAFSGNDKTTEAWVESGAADAGAMACGDVKEGAKILAKSPNVPRALVAFHTSLPEAERKAIETKLASLGADNPALKSGGKASKIEPIKAKHLDALKAMEPHFQTLVKLLPTK